MSNSYIIAEITSNSLTMEQTLIQLEKSLCFLLLKHQKETESPIATIELIISYAFLLILSKEDVEALIHKTITEKKLIFPLLFRLYELGRFARYFSPKGKKAIMTEMVTAHIVNNPSSSSRLSSQEKLKTWETMLKLMLYVAKNLLPSDPEVADLISEIETEGFLVRRRIRRSK